METPSPRRQESPGPRRPWSAPCLDKLHGQHDVLIGVGGNFDGSDDSTNFS